MSLFDDIAHAIGHTVDTLAQDVGTGVSELESLVAGLANDGVEVFSAAEHFGLSMVDFLRRMVTLLRGDPHQVLLHYVTGPIKPVNEQVDTLSMHWTQMAALHQDTAQTINAHLSDLYQANGSFSYSGQAAEALWNTHQQYQQHFTALVEHAQTQQTRHATLGSHTSDFLSQAPGKVYSLSAPMAALGVMSFEMTAVAPPPVLDDPAVQGVEQGIEETVQTGEEGPPGILWIIIGIIVVVLVLVLVIVVLYVLIRDAIEFFQNQQKSTTVQQPKHKPMVAPPSTGHSPQNSLTPAQETLAKQLYADYGHLGLSLDDIRKIIEDNPNLTEAQLRQLLVQYANVIKDNPNLVKKYGALQVFMAFVALSAYDPAHKGNYPTRTAVVDQDLTKRIEEAETLLGAAEAGDLPWPLTPSTDPAYEATDANGQKWDVKAWRSGIRPPFNANTALNTIKKEVIKSENILVNDKYLSVADRQDLAQAIKGAGLEGHVVWWPDQP